MNQTVRPPKAMPFVKREVACSVLAKFRGGCIGEGLERLREQVRRDNPEFVDCIELWAAGCEDEDARKFAEWTGLLGYALVQSQVEANQLSRELHGRIYG